MKKFTQYDPKTNSYIQINDDYTPEEYKKDRANFQKRSLYKKASEFKEKAKKVSIVSGGIVLGMMVLTGMAQSGKIDHTAEINRLTIENTEYLKDITAIKSEWVEANALREEGETELESARMKVSDALMSMDASTNGAQQLRDKISSNEKTIEMLMDEMAGLAHDQK